jgi:uncharacterized protein YvpB
MLSAAAVLIAMNMEGPQTALLSIERADFVVSEQRLTIDVALPFPAAEVIPSWKASAVPGAVFDVEIQPIYGLEEGPVFKLGKWSLGEERTSYGAQENEFGKVRTDTLSLTTPASNLRININLTAAEDIETLYLAISGSSWSTDAETQHRETWGRSIDVPTRAQHDYPNGKVLCSPTSLSMLLAYWSEHLDRQDLLREVPEIQLSIFDPEWGGTGNWPFNTAYAAQFEGITGYVSRLRGLADLERLLDAGVPVAVSIAYSKLLGEDWGREEADDGHIMVALGFTENGDVVVNDPAKQSQVRRIYRRKAFIESWAASKNTVYVVHPIGWPMPDGDGPWERSH